MQSLESRLLLAGYDGSRWAIDPTAPGFDSADGTPYVWDPTFAGEAKTIWNLRRRNIVYTNGSSNTEGVRVVQGNGDPEYGHSHWPWSTVTIRNVEVDDVDDAGNDSRHTDGFFINNKDGLEPGDTLVFDASDSVLAMENIRSVNLEHNQGIQYQADARRVVFRNFYTDNEKPQKYEGASGDMAFHIRPRGGDLEGSGSSIEEVVFDNVRADNIFFNVDENDPDAYIHHIWYKNVDNKNPVGGMDLTINNQSVHVPFEIYAMWLPVEQRKTIAQQWINEGKLVIHPEALPGDMQADRRFTDGFTTGTIQGEEFDNGGEGLAFHIKASARGEETYWGRSGISKVDRSAVPTVAGDLGGQAVRGTTGEWIEYTFEAPVQGTYDITAHVKAGAGTSSRFRMTIDDDETPGTNIFTTSDDWQDKKLENVQLKPGRHILHVQFLDSGGTSPQQTTTDLDWVNIASDSVTPSPVGRTDYQAENTTTSTWSGPIVNNTDPNSEGGYIDFQNASNDYLEITVNAPYAADYRLDFHYGNGGAADRPLELKVNGTVKDSALSFAPTGSWGTWTTTSKLVSLNAGANTIRLTATGASGANIDKLTVVRPSQAEDTTNDVALSGAVAQGVHPGYTGTGYADYNSTVPSGEHVEFQHIWVPKAGSYKLDFRYANGDVAGRPLELKVNGTQVDPALAFDPTGSWTTWALASKNVTLAAGDNIVRLTSIGSSGPNLDSAIAAPAATTGGTNKITGTNSTFESGLGNWERIRGTVALDTTHPKTGTRSMQVGTTPSEARLLVTGLQPNTTYTLSAFVGVANAADTGVLGVMRTNGAVIAQADYESTAYQPLNVQFTTAAGETSIIAFVSIDTGGQSWVDDFQLV